MLQMPIQINGEEYYTATEAARYLGVSGATFVKFQEEFHLRAISRPGMGQRKFFKKADLEPILKWRPVENDENKSE